MQVIDRIHRNFFANKRLREVDVRLILAAEQRRVLAGCHVLFSRIFPVGEVNPHLHPLWRMAEQFGASCCLHINDKVTHVVAISLGTDKVSLMTFILLSQIISSPSISAVHDFSTRRSCQRTPLIMLPN